MPAPPTSRGRHLRQTVQAAYDIARFTAEDPAAGLPDAEDLASAGRGGARPRPVPPLGHRRRRRRPNWRSAARPRRWAVDRRIANSEGAGVSAQQSHFWAGNTRGFRGGYASSRHYLSVSPIAGKGKAMQRDSLVQLDARRGRAGRPEAVGRYAAERALARLKSRRVATAEVPVLFESTVAAGLLGAFVQATSGGALYRKASFLLDCLGQPCWPRTWTSTRTRMCPRARAVRPSTTKACARARAAWSTRRRAGLFPVQLLGAQAGPEDHRPRRRLAEPAPEQPPHPPATTSTRMLRKLGRGLFVTELMGQGVNYVTGDYSRGAAGFWVEDGRIAYPVHEVTIAGNLREMFARHPAVGADAYTQGSKTVGSVLIGRMKLAGGRLTGSAPARPDCCARISALTLISASF
jgi:PmbA protein